MLLKSMAAEGGWHAQLIVAEGDGVAPSVLLTVDASEVCACVPTCCLACWLLRASVSMPLVYCSAPSDLVTRRSTVAQYIFNVPEGFARLVIEHECRPSTLQAVFALGLQSNATVS